MMWVDKQKAIHQRWRISEKQLWLTALCLGALGMSLGMWQFHHKSKTWYFRYGLPILTLIQLFILIL